MGLAFLHYAVEVPKDKGGALFQQWIGGYYEDRFSCNPMWAPDYQTFPQHPITRGVKPFKVPDEWYFHMRFRDGMKDVLPILSAVAPESTMRRSDGPHEGNPAVRELVARGEPVHVAWAAERPGGGAAGEGRRDLVEPLIVRGAVVAMPNQDVKIAALEENAGNHDLARALANSAALAAADAVYCAG